MRFDCTEISGWMPAIVGMRLPMCRDVAEAMDKSDTDWSDTSGPYRSPVLGRDDLRIACSLIKADGARKAAGTPNSKFLQMIQVWVSIQAPISWWMEFDTYRHTVKNSTSRMHGLAKRPIDVSMFEPNPITGGIPGNVDVEALEGLRQRYLATEDKAVWYDLLYSLPPSYLQTRMVNMNYQTVRSICQWRWNHKQTCWSGQYSAESFLGWAATLPYAREFLLRGEV